MLVLQRKERERIVMRWGDETVTITVTRIHRDPGKVSIGIEAPQTVTVDREEVDKAKRREKRHRI